MNSYEHLLSPIMVGNHLFKNRIVMTPTTPQYLQEDEDYPAENLAEHYIRRARNGAALVTLSGLYQFTEENPCPHEMRDYFKFDIEHGENHYLAQLVEELHGFGTYVTITVQHVLPPNKDVCAGALPFGATLYEDIKTASEELTPDDLKTSTDDLVRKCVILKHAGLDGIYLHMSYQAFVLGRFLSPVTNKRTDQYGGSFENRIRLVKETCQAIKAACGEDFIIEAHITGEERDPETNELIPGGWTADDSVRFAEAMSGLIDILHIRGWSVDEQHPTWLRPDIPPYQYLAEKCMAANTKTKILSTSGHKNPDEMDAVIAEGRADLIGMARSLIADPEFVQKLYENRADDIVPCLRCNKCFDHGPEGTPRTCRCSVNPLWGIESRETRLFTPPTAKRKVAIAGGGPAGMLAALVCKRRGHDVTLFEKGDKLGGQLNIADYAPRKWSLREYRDYLVHQIEKQAVPVEFGTEVTPELISREQFDVVIAALGSVPKTLDVPGADRGTVYDVMAAYDDKVELGNNIVVIGGGTTAIETAMHLAEEKPSGRHVTLLGRNPVIGKDMPPAHYRHPMMAEWESLGNLETHTGVKVQEIKADGVRYCDAEGREQLARADSVVVCIGMKPRHDEAIKLFGSGARVIIVGDNRIPGSLMEINRDAYFGAMQV